MIVNKYSILPTTSSLLREMLLVIVIFTFFCVYVCYISAYNTGYRPNFVMFINLIVDDYSALRNFKTYIQNIVDDHTTSESFANFRNSPYTRFKNKINRLFQKVSYKFKIIASKLFIKGNKVSLSYR
jgi:hypothetical protein